MAASITTHDRRVLHAKGPNGISVHQHVIRRYPEAAEGPPHGQDGGVVDVEPIDLANRCGADADAERPIMNARRQLLTLGARELLRVVHSANRASVRRHHDRACDDGARKGAPSDFVDSGEERTP